MQTHAILHSPLTSLPPASDAGTFDFTQLANYVPPDKTLIREGMTCYNAPSRCFKVVGSGLYGEGLYRERGPLEFAYMRPDDTSYVEGWDRDAFDTLHDLCLFCVSALSSSSSIYREGIAEMTAELKARNLPLPLYWFPVYGHSYPGSRGFAAVINGALIVL
jgi:hypothetical protein